MEIIKLDWDLYFYFYEVNYEFNKKINFKGICKDLIKKSCFNEPYTIFGFYYQEVNEKPIIKQILYHYNIYEEPLADNYCEFYRNTIFKTIPYKRELLKNDDNVILDENYEPKTIYRVVRY